MCSNSLASPPSEWFTSDAWLHVDRVAPTTTWSGRLAMCSCITDRETIRALSEEDEINVVQEIWRTIERLGDAMFSPSHLLDHIRAGPISEAPKPPFSIPMEIEPAGLSCRVELVQRLIVYARLSNMVDDTFTVTSSDTNYGRLVQW